MERPETSLTLRRKTLLIVSLILLSMLVLLFLSANFMILQSYGSLEDTFTQQSVQRLLNVVAHHFTSLGSTAADWAYWDETYQFVQDVNEDYISNNLNNESITNLQLNFMLFINTSGQLVYSKFVDTSSGLETDLPAGLEPYFQQDGALLTQVRATGETSGFIVLNDGILLVAGKNILTSASEGPSQGTLVIGHFVDETYINMLLSTMQEKVTIMPLAAVQNESPLNSLTANSPILVRQITADTIAGYALLNDVEGKPGLIAGVELPRYIYAQARNTLDYFLGAFLLIGVSFILVTLVTTEQLILRRLSELSRIITHIRKTHDLSTPIPVAGRDEISNLASGMKEMLDMIAASQLDLQRANDDLQQKVDERTKELRTMRDQAVDNLRIKAQILANVSHDARTPLNVIMLRAEMLQMQRYGEINRKQSDMIDGIMYNARELLNFLNSLLSEAQMDSKQIKPNCSEFTPAELLNLIVLSNEPLIERKGLHLETCLGPNLPPVLYTDQEWIKQIINNLIGNAIKFTEKGSIRVDFLYGDENHWLIEVSDTGPGIPTEALENIFEPFWQVEEATIQNSNQGVGLGLSIVKNLTKIMGGSITVHSELNVGTTFSVQLPTFGVPMPQSEQTNPQSEMLS